LSRKKFGEWLAKKPANNLRLSAEEFIRSLHLIVSLDQLLETFSAKLRELINAGTVYVVLFEPITNRYVGKKAKGSAPEWLTALNFSPSDNLMRWLGVNQCPLDVPGAAGVMEFLSPGEREILRQTGTVLVIPLIVLNRLTGVVFVTKKLTEESYSSEEVAILSMLTDQSALAIEHALTYEFQEERLRKLFHADKLSTIGELAAGVAHEIRNPLTAIRSTAQYVRRDLSGEKQTLIDGVIEEVDRINRIIEGLLSFSRMSDLQITDVGIEEILDQTLLLLDPELRHHEITVQRHSHLIVPQIPADASQLKQVFLNILLNSIQAMPNGGTVTITTTDIVKQKSACVCVTISDTGPGIPEHDLQKVFNPFYTTKEAGTGLGLSIAYGIVSKHGGEVEIESTAEGSNTGTAVSVWLPKAVRQSTLLPPY
jgi:signal transduction histidine kinase